MRPSASPPANAGGSAIKRLWPIAALLVAVVALFFFGPNNEAILEALHEHRETVLAFVADNAVLAGLAYVTVYVLAIAFSVPGGAMMTIAGGFLFDWQLATIYVVFAATVGATAVFIVARSAVGNRLRARAGPWMKKMEAGFQENALNYLLVLRLIPVFPFFVINLVSAFLGVNLRTYVIATFIGIIPGTIVFALFGDGLGSLLDADAEFDISTVLTPQIMAALAGLAALAAAPVIYKKMRARKS
ncbi:MAG: TVP38/TMEM64 family protein [Proteobacteria bacterium]|nr:TVP38/TMEM64 family protein [Pseudomonadota bacterium]